MFSKSVRFCAISSALCCLFSTVTVAQPLPVPGLGRGPVRVESTSSQALLLMIESGTSLPLSGTDWQIPSNSTAALARPVVPVNIYFAGDPESGVYRFTYTDTQTGVATTFPLDVERLVSVSTTAWTGVPFSFSLQRHALSTYTQTGNLYGVVVIFNESGEPGQVHADVFGDTTVFAQPRVITIYLTPLIRMVRQNLQSLINTGVVASSTTIHQAVELFLGITLRHELGHAFGLEHTEHAWFQARTLLQPLPGGRLLTGGVVQNVVYDERPSIMIDNPFDYLRELRRHFVRAVDSRDVVPGRRDIEGAARLFNAGHIAPNLRGSWWGRARSIMVCGSCSAPPD